MKNKIIIVGIGPGAEDLIVLRAEKVIREAKFLVGGKRHLELYGEGKETCVINAELDRMKAFIDTKLQEDNVIIVASGDPGLYSIAQYIHRNYDDEMIETIAGISAYTYFMSQLGVSWHDVVIKSTHGREAEFLIRDIAANAKTIVFTDKKQSPAAIAKRLMARGLSGLELSVGENLSYPHQRIVKGSLEEIAEMEFDHLSMLFVYNPNPLKLSDIPAYGIEDSAFLRAKVPMTKAEIRGYIMTKLDIRGEEIVYDVGAGSGSVTIECALHAVGGMVYAIERKPEAVELIEKNKAHFGLYNIEVIHALAPAVEAEMPAPDRVFIGGSAGNMAEIVEWLVEKDNDFRIVISAITVETVTEALSALQQFNFINNEIVSLNIARGRKVGRKHLMEANNPIYIISADYKVK